MTERITIRRPDDWHLHVRDGAMLRTVLPYTARVFARAIIMPNLKPPVTTTAMAAQYRQRILAACPRGAGFEPLMTLYLTDTTDAQDLVRGFRDRVVVAAKLYPAGATTNSEAGVTDIRRIDSVLHAMEAAGIPLLVHGEVNDPDVDVFDREAVFIDRVLGPLVERHSKLKLVLEHVTTKEGIGFVRAAGPSMHADDRIVIAGHAGVGHVGGAAGEDLVVGGRHMGVGADDETGAAVAEKSDALLFAASPRNGNRPRWHPPPRAADRLRVRG